jgi:diguanylate cyclase (GGDEF)-like protein
MIGKKMNLTRNYKIKILFILITGFFIVSLITIISTYSIYQYKHLQLVSNSTKVVKLFDDNFKYILQDLEYFKSIDFSQDSQKILTDFKQLSQIMYNHNNNVNAISLIRQFNTLDYKEIATTLEFIPNKLKPSIRPITDIIKNSKKSDTTFSSIIMHSEPVEKTKKSIGIELSSEENRYQIILRMHNTNNYVISRAVKLVHKYKDKISNSIIFYPLFKNEKDDFYTWFMATPFTYKKILDNIVSSNPSFRNFYIEIIDNNENIIVGTHGLNIAKSKRLILEEQVNISRMQYTIKIFTAPLPILDTFWQNILGFTSGIIFLFFIGYYLFYKEQRNVEISGLKFHLSEAQKISSSGHCIWKKESNVFSCSESFVNILELKEFTINTKVLMNRIYKEDKRKVYTHIKKLRQKDTPRNGNITCRMIVSNNLKWLKIEYRVFYNEKEKLEEIFIVAQDVTSFKTLEIALKENNVEFKKLAITDHLTGAFNRVHFDKEIKTVLSHYNRYNHIFSILLLDIDHFKNINDQYGHNEGDNVLIQFSTLLKSQLRETDIFARWGGEEFAVLIPNVDKENATHVAEKLREAIENFSFSKGYNITCSIGITEVEKGDDKVTLFNRVDDALYSAKENGRNIVKVG